MCETQSMVLFCFSLLSDTKTTSVIPLNFIPNWNLIISYASKVSLYSIVLKTHFRLFVIGVDVKQFLSLFEILQKWLMTSII